MALLAPEDLVLEAVVAVDLAVVVEAEELVTAVEVVEDKLVADVPELVAQPGELARTAVAD